MFGLSNSFELPIQQFQQIQNFELGDLCQFCDGKRIECGSARDTKQNKKNKERLIMWVGMREQKYNTGE